MKVLPTLLPFVLLPALFVTEMNQATAGSFSFDKAIWRNSKDLLVFKGTGTPGDHVEAYISGTEISLGTKTINRQGRWRFKFYNPEFVPCAIRAASGPYTTIRGVSSAPADCVDGNNLPAENNPPVISGTPSTLAAEGTAYSFRPNAGDADGDNLVFSIANKPSWASFNASTGALSGTPGFGDGGMPGGSSGTTSDIRISVSDGKASASLSPFSITVTNTNRPPTISGSPSTSVAEGAHYGFLPSASDADGDGLVFSITNKPSWASFNASTGALSGTPGFGDGGMPGGSSGTTSDIRISVSDGKASALLSPFSITVTNTNRPPTISGTPSTSVAEGAHYGFLPSASDADDDGLVFSIANKPAWASFNASTGALSGTPDLNDAGTTGNIRISVSDGSASAALSAFSITVTNTNQAPTISGTPVLSIDEGNAYRFTPNAGDPDGDSLTFSITNLPNWAAFDSSNGSLSGTPDSDSAGVYSNIVITVSDGSKQASLAPFGIAIADVPQGGTFQFASSTYSVDEGNNLTLTVIRDNSAGVASVNYGTIGVEAKYSEDYIGYVWTPLTFQDGESSKTIQLSTLSDDIVENDETLGVHLDSASSGYSLASPSVSVVTIHDMSAPNQAPTISGTPAQSVIEGNEYLFAPTATDPDGDSLSFSVTNLPGWAVFDTNNGELSGTPTAADVGPYEGIVISVTDGEETASLAPMSLQVENSTSTTGSISLSWVPPVTRTDGAPLDMSEIAGYKIYMGNSQDNLAPIMEYEDCTIQNHLFDNLETGDYYFAVTAYDTDGIESGFSNVAMKSAM
ncbi:MAG: putative Ig domain-containing protein [Candidatus Thiodiazotropha sp. (ex Epidulcina cf. delphinae)]|nr:putative Ig domain-containing protein [Candidatus Thiodiazotropha sp. (ex Epidulcina cf. delphinae)]